MINRLHNPEHMEHIVMYGCVYYDIDMVYYFTVFCCYRLSLASVNHHKGLPLESRGVLLEVATVKLYPWMSSIFI
jgi:hypothetical protein